MSALFFGVFDGFDWDDGNWPKCARHGLSKEEIESVFEGDPYIKDDDKHSRHERRFLAIGIASTGRHVFVAFTIRNRMGERLIRPISARYMHEKEVRRHEQCRQTAEKDPGAFH